MLISTIKFVLGFLYDVAFNGILSLVEMNIVPDFLIRHGVRLLQQTRIDLEEKGGVEERQRWYMELVEGLKKRNIAEQTGAANEQHYEVPTEFYDMVLGKNYKYSCCLFSSPTDDLDVAELAMLELYTERAQLKDGQNILELGCGWGSLCLYVANKYPKSKVTAVSNSKTQKDHIMGECVKRGINNLQIVTADINSFTPPQPGTYDRCLSIEMFEHMKNYKELMLRISGWLKPGGLLFVHIFVHKVFAYHFEVQSEDDWMARYFFTGGTMPSDHLLLYFQEQLKIVNHWSVNGNHYALTSEAWLKKMDANKKKVMSIMRDTYGAHQQTKWFVYWRLFFIAVAEMFAWDKGNEWYVSHYLFEKPEA
mmetsp:Transcript_42589/g.71086  ORF Transcript_42589/g.71086 Transcript_42589/m.71086 type:complete len:365 (+) Transcript_42589:128-1222(+)|eukprot:CAMPEP_0198199848 /NCGR_PEP_ID=MMETSP1445-20131203/2985_1 /TAXON_ID=36898 /ORGANISM="Pyramimonas sp., Strain CCMP2087" /LENGTH=364 /DNA_ID=CAMNT_0043869749 /DNA_START=121 /DNA_END=1215 /DNA_ORIENTATION=+